MKKRSKQITHYPLLLCLLICSVFLSPHLSPCFGYPCSNTFEKAEAQHEVENYEKTSRDARINWVDNIHAKVSGTVTGTAEWLDSFFKDERSEYEANTTRIRLGLQGFVEEGENVELKTRSNLRLVLPNVDERIHLLFTADPDEDDLEIGGVPVDKPQDDPSETDGDGVTASLRYFFENTMQRNISASAGVRIKGFSPVFFPQARYRQTFDLDPWTLRFEERVTWYSDRGWESRTRFDLEKPVHDTLFFRSTWEGKWYDDRAGYFYDLGFRFYQTLGKTRVMSYEWNNSYETCPVNKVTQLVWKVSYRQSFWRDWLFVEIAPQLAMYEANDYDVKPGVLLKFEGYFGDYSSK